MKKIFLILFCIPLILSAQIYYLDDLIDNGLQNNLSLKQAQLILENANSKKIASQWNLYPDVSVGSSHKEYFSDKPQNAKDNSFDFSVSKNISLNDQAWFSYMFNNFDYETAKIQYDFKKKSFIYQIINDYIAVLNLQKQFNLLNENKEIQQMIVNQSKVLFYQQKATSFDVSQSEITLLNAEISILKVKNDLATKRKQLFNNLNMIDNNYLLSDLEFNSEYSIPEHDIKANNDVILLEREIKRNKLSLTQNNLKLFPSLNLSYNYSQGYVSNTFKLDNKNTNHTVMLSLSYSFKDFFVDHQSKIQTRNIKRSNELSLTDKENNLTNQYSQLSDELGYLENLHQLYLKKVKQTNENLSIATERYKLGLIPQLDFDKARYEFLDAKIALESNQYEIISKRENINFLMSKKLLNKW